MHQFYVCCDSEVVKWDKVIKWDRRYIGIINAEQRVAGCILEHRGKCGGNNWENRRKTVKWSGISEPMEAEPKIRKLANWLVS